MTYASLLLRGEQIRQQEPDMSSEEATGPLNKADEEFYESLRPEVLERLHAASEGLDLCTSIAEDAALGRPLRDRQVVLSLLATKAIDHLDGARLAISVGQLPNAPVMLRSAVATMGVLLRGTHNRTFLDRWLFLTCLGREHFEDESGRAEKFDRMVRTIERQGLEEFDYQLPGNEAPGAATKASRQFILHSHPTILGVLETLGLDLSDRDRLSHYLLEVFFGVDAWGAVQNAKGDPYDAFEGVQRFRRVRRKRGQGGSHTGRHEANEPESHLLVRSQSYEHQSEFLQEYSTLLLAAVHHLYDFLTSIFEGDVKDHAPQVEWHDQVLGLLASQ